jgi:hypothetical protein
MVISESVFEYLMTAPHKLISNMAYLEISILEHVVGF